MFLRWRAARLEPSQIARSQVGAVRHAPHRALGSRVPATAAGVMEPPLRQLLQEWPFWAVMSAVFAALTAIFAKVGVAQVNPDFATFIRTIVIAVALAGIVAATGQFQPPAAVTARSWLFLLLSGLATGASWMCYFRALKLGDAARVAPIDKLSVVLVAVFGVLFLGEHLSGSKWVGVCLIAVGALLVAGV